MTVATAVAKPLAPIVPASPKALATAEDLRDQVVLDGARPAGLASTLGQGAAAVGGAAVGYYGANLASSAARAVGGLTTQFVFAAMPQIVTTPELTQLLNATLAVGIGGGAFLAAGAGALTGAGVAWYAASKTEKVDDAVKWTQAEGQGMASRLTAGLREDGAQLRSALAGVHRAESFGEAAGQGFEAGATMGGRVGMYAGKVQGALMGAAVGATASLPVTVAVNGLVALPLAGAIAVALPLVLMGGALGGKLGEAVGHTAGSLVGGAVGAAGGAMYHGGHKLVSHG